MSGLFSKPNVQTPEVKPPAPMPDPDGPASEEARRRSQIATLSRGGRSSTILTAPGNRGDSSTYSGSRLGSNA